MHRREKRWSTVGVGAFCAAGVLACNAPSAEGLYGPAGSVAAGSGGTGVGGAQGGAGGQAAAGSAGSGGNTVDASASGGTGGLMSDNPDASIVDASAPSDAGADAAGPCDGALLGGICWYLGAPGASCNQACSSRGGFDTASIEVVGTPAQGGSLEECSAVLEALLGESQEGVQSGVQVEEGVGCHLYDTEDDGQVRWWLTSPDFDADASLVGAPLACGCDA